MLNIQISSDGIILAARSFLTLLLFLVFIFIVIWRFNADIYTCSVSTDFPSSFLLLNYMNFYFGGTKVLSGGICAKSNMSV